jgi:hypothetical protein
VEDGGKGERDGDEFCDVYDVYDAFCDVHVVNI